MIRGIAKGGRHLRQAALPVYSLQHSFIDLHAPVG
jgi:hypothetical protein